ncbi:hypothetical protein CS548_10675 [Porphyromonas gingivalis]|nr:hypothetical protein CS548_10675 [Porphyromonas gingivalis]
MQVAPQGGIYNYFHSLLPPLSLAPFMPRTPLYSISLFCKGLIFSAVFAKFLGTMDAIYPISSQISIKKYVLITAFRVTLGH